MAPRTDSSDKPADTTHFGYKDVPVDDKADLVKGVFDSVASRYDIMNDLMSAGMHRLWKRYTVQHANARPGQVILDLAGGTGDLTREFARTSSPQERQRLMRACIAVGAADGVIAGAEATCLAMLQRELTVINRLQDLHQELVS